jgi:prolyl-tRNA synthetase
MNDLYSFDDDEQGSELTYQRISDVYKRIFWDRLGLKETMIVQAETGEIGGTSSHEYHLPNVFGQERLLVCSKCESTRMASKDDLCSNCGQEAQSITSIEVGHTFKLGTKYSSLFGAVNSKGQPYEMCCFGIGISRLIAAR